MGYVKRVPYPRVTQPHDAGWQRLAASQATAVAQLAPTWDELGDSYRVAGRRLPDERYNTFFSDAWQQNATVPLITTWSPIEELRRSFRTERRWDRPINTEPGDAPLTWVGSQVISTSTLAEMPAIDQLLRSVRLRRPTVVLDGRRHIEYEHGGGRGADATTYDVSSGFPAVIGFGNSLRTPPASRDVRPSIDPYGIWTLPANSFTDFFTAGGSTAGIWDFTRSAQTRRADARQWLYQTEFGRAPLSTVPTAPLPGWDPATFNAIMDLTGSERTRRGPTGAWENFWNSRISAFGIYRLYEPYKFMVASRGLTDSDRTRPRLTPYRYYDTTFPFVQNQMDNAAQVRAAVEHFWGSERTRAARKLDVRLAMRHQGPDWQSAIPAADDAAAWVAVNQLWQSYRTLARSVDVHHTVVPDVSWIRPIAFNQAWLAAMFELASSFQTGRRSERDVRLRTNLADTGWLRFGATNAVFNPAFLPPLLELLNSARTRPVFRHVNQFSADFMAAWLQYAETVVSSAPPRLVLNPPGFRRSGRRV